MEEELIEINKINACECGNLLFKIRLGYDVVCMKCSKCGNERKWLRKTFEKFKKRMATTKKDVKVDKQESKKLNEIKRKLGIEIAYSSRKTCQKCRNCGFYACLVHNVKVEKNEVCKHFKNKQFQQRVSIVQGGRVSPK